MSGVDEEIQNLSIEKADAGATATATATATTAEKHNQALNSTLKTGLDKSVESQTANSAGSSPTSATSSSNNPHYDVKSTIKSTKLNDEQAQKLTKLISSVPDILKQTKNPAYDEIFGYRINSDGLEYVDIPKRNEILLKFLAADNYDLDLATKRLIATFNWRNEFQPLHAAFDEQFHQELNELGVITQFASGNDNLHVITWNLYGNLKSPKKIFQKFGEGADDGQREGLAKSSSNSNSNSSSSGNNRGKNLPGSQFLRWRIGLMEKALQLVDFTDSKNHKIAQIHDYNNVSMFRIDPGMKAATKEIIEIFGQNYPELLSTKYFINVPLIMGWVFTFFKTIGVISAETLKKFQVLNHGDLKETLPKLELPESYGGVKSAKGDPKRSLFDLDVSESIKLTKYGQVVLQRLGDEEIAHNNDEVE